MDGRIITLSIALIIGAFAVFCIRLIRKLFKEMEESDRRFEERQEEIRQMEDELLVGLRNNLSNVRNHAYTDDRRNQ